jgi:hypothetical protein
MSTIVPSTSQPNAAAEFTMSINIFSILIAAALVLKIIFQVIQQLKTEDAALTVATTNNPTGTNPSKLGGQADSTIGMYGWAAFWIVSLMVTTIAVLLRKYRISSLTCTLNTLFYISPFVMIIALVVWTILQNYTYRKQINMNLIPSSYMTWSITSTVNILLMFGVMYAFLRKMLTCSIKENKINDESIMILLTWTALILGALTSGIILISHVLVACYTTDG